MKADTSSERSFRRRLALLALLHARPYHMAEIFPALAAVGCLDHNVPDEAVPTAAHTASFRLDLSALRAAGCDIVYTRARGYRWCNSPFGLHLTPAQLDAFRIVLETFTDKALPHAADMAELLAYLSRLLPQEQQTALVQYGHTFSIALHERTDYRSADPATLAQIERAIRQKVQLAFEYRSPHQDGPRQHVIEPEPLVYENGHVYLKGWGITWGDKTLRFRLDYVTPGSARALARRIQPRPKAREMEVRYRLSPGIAHNKVSVHFPGQQVEQHADGSATVTASVTDIFEAQRILISYGEHCQVLSGPPTLMENLRRTAAALYKMYCPTTT